MFDMTFAKSVLKLPIGSKYGRIIALKISALGEFALIDLTEYTMFLLHLVFT